MNDPNAVHKHGLVSASRVSVCHINAPLVADGQITVAFADEHLQTPICILRNKIHVYNMKIFTSKTKIG
jgi:hypothetical protein